MITAEEIIQKAERKYLDYLRGIVVGTEFLPIEIICDKKPSTTMDAFQKELRNLRSFAKEIKGYGYTIEWKTINTKTLGLQSLPNRILFESANDFEHFLHKVSEVAQFRKDISLISVKYPILVPWMEKYPHKVIDNTAIWNDLFKVLDYFSSNPHPQLYIRELPIEVHTKFIENNKAIIHELLDIVMADDINANENEFEKRFNLRFDEPVIRLRVLDTSLIPSLFSGIDDVAIPVSHFSKLSLPVSKVFIVENKVNFLTFPSVEDSVVVWGHGYGLSSMKDSNWLKSKNLYYWGDIDAQGFEILSQFRGYFPQAKSLMMDRTTFDKFFENDPGTPSKVTVELNLTAEETTLYEYIKSNTYRLEQEKIPHYYVVEQLRQL